MSYIGIVVLACILLGAVLFSFSVRELNSAYLETQQQRFDTAAELLEQNFELMEDMSYRLKSSSVMRSEYLNRSGYNPAQTLAYLRNFESFVPIADEFFVIYNERESVFRVMDGAATNTFNVLCNVYLGIRDRDYVEALKEQIRGAEASTLIMPEYALSNAPEGMGTFALFAVPFTMSEYHADRAVLVFVVRIDRVIDVLSASIGDMDIPIKVSFGDEVLLCTQEGAYEQTEVRCLLNDRLCVRLDMAGIGVYARLGTFSRTMYLYIAAVVIVLLVSACYLSWTNYRPIRDLSRRYAPSVSASDELKALSTMFENLFEEKRLSTQRLHQEIQTLSQQRSAIRRQIVQLLICGQFDIENTRDLKYLDLISDVTSYCVLVLYPAEDGFADLNTLITKLEKLGDENLTLRGTALAGETSAVFICAARDAADLRDVSDMVEALALEVDDPVRSVSGLICDTLSRIPISFLDALNRANLPNSPSFSAEFAGVDACARRMAAELAVCNVDQALAFLDQAMELVGRDDPLYVRMSMNSSVINSLSQLAYRMQLGIAGDQFNSIMILQDPETFRSMTEELIRSIAQAIEQGSEQPQTEILDYIRDHLGDYDLSVSSLSNVFSIPEKNVSRIIKEITGLSYKEYLNQARVERAKELLVKANLSVTETCTQVGLSEVSYFIRIFKKLTGETPANYKRRML
ncbi:MAG: helix-turn-helix domain-containing protein [Ruminococcaceae bacterium]|nr:helix-turn-helix domain-containing protein [Oscillospiraceae bacterium]